MSQNLGKVPDVLDVCRVFQFEFSMISFVYISYRENGFLITAAAKLLRFDKNCNINEGFCYIKENYIQLLHLGKIIVTPRLYLTKRLKH